MMQDEQKHKIQVEETHNSELQNHDEGNFLPVYQIQEGKNTGDNSEVQTLEEEYYYPDSQTQPKVLLPTPNIQQSKENDL